MKTILVHGRGWGAIAAAAVLCAVVGAMLALGSSSAAAAGTTVTVGSSCTLADAVAYADGTAESGCAPTAAAGTTTIEVPAGSYTLSATLDLTADVAIDGAGASTTTISGGGNVQVVNIATGVTAGISGVTISGGNSGDATTGCTYLHEIPLSCPAENGNPGGGIYNAGTLKLSDAVVTGNTTGTGAFPYSEVHFICSSNCAPSDGQSAGDSGDGGGIYNAGGASLDVEDSVISGNSTGDALDGTDGVSGTGDDQSPGYPGGNGADSGAGGGISSYGALTVNGSTISGNVTGDGGDAGNGSDPTEAVADGGDAGSAGNAGNGGGIDSEGGGLTVTSSTIAGNTTGNGGYGGAGGQGDYTGLDSNGGNGGAGAGVFFTGSATAAFTNDTIVGNSSGPGGAPAVSDAYAGEDGNGGGIMQDGGSISLGYATIAGNTAAGEAGALDSGGGTLTVAESVIAGNSGDTPAGCAGAVDGGFNIQYQSDSCPGTSGNPKLAALADNGGPTQTLALGAGSAAIGAIPAADCDEDVDQRGAARPEHAAACDAGAYEVAPPSIGGAAVSSSGVVSAVIGPNATDTRVTVDYGTGTGYGSSVAAQDVGSGTGTVEFSVTLPGLAAGTSYHAKIVASNADGTSSSADLPFTTAAAGTTTTGSATGPGSGTGPGSATGPGSGTGPGSATGPGSGTGATVTSAITLAGETTLGPALTLQVSCGKPAGICSGTGALTAHVTTLGKRVTAVTASASMPTAARAKTPAKPRRKTTLETVGNGSYHVAAGAVQTITIPLNRIGRALLNARYRLPATLTASGDIALTKQVVLSYGRIHARLSIGWARRGRSAAVTRATLSALPADVRVTVLCRGRGCAFAKRIFTPASRSLSLTAALAHHDLAADGELTLEITAAGDVGQVQEFTVSGQGRPVAASRCLVPGESRPSVCA